MEIKIPTNKQLLEILLKIRLSNFELNEEEIKNGYGEEITNYLKQISFGSGEAFIFYGEKDKKFLVNPLYTDRKISELENKVFQEKQIEINKSQEEISKTLLIAISIQALALFFQVILINIIPIILNQQGQEGISQVGYSILGTIKIILIIFSVASALALLMLIYQLIRKIFEGKLNKMSN